jgi:hypothetical protein
MPTCPLRRASMEARQIAAHGKPRMCANANARCWMTAVSESLVGLTGWRALRDLLNAIPDSNDDFGLF